LETNDEKYTHDQNTHFPEEFPVVDGFARQALFPQLAFYDGVTEEADRAVHREKYEKTYKNVVEGPHSWYLARSFSASQNPNLKFWGNLFPYVLVLLGMGKGTGLAEMSRR